MSNMSYCRFQNTLSDLLDCRNALDAMIDGDGDTTRSGALSEYEEEAAMQLVELCADILRRLGEGMGLNDYVTLQGDDPKELVRCFNAEARQRHAKNLSDG
jgi:hypothetical protein